MNGYGVLVHALCVKNIPLQSSKEMNTVALSFGC